MNEYQNQQYDCGIFSDPAPSPGEFDHLRKPRKITRHTTKTKAQGHPGSRSKSERRIRREKRAQRSANRK